MKQQIIDTISTLETQRLEDCLLNFELRRSPSTFEILNKLIETYTKVINVRDNMKLPFIISHLETLNIVSKEYKEFLKKSTDVYLKNSNEYPSYIHS